MPTQTKSNAPLVLAIENAAHAAGLDVLSTTPGEGARDGSTTRFILGHRGRSDAGHTAALELSNEFDLGRPSLLPKLSGHLGELAMRLHGPRPDCEVTLAGLPVRMADFTWPFHRSTSGADTFILHGEVYLEDGQETHLHAQVAVSMTVTFTEIVGAAEQPYVEGPVYNAIRKTLDRGQLELVKSGNRQPVPLSMRYYSRWQNRFLFTETTDEARRDHLALKVYWLSGVLGNGAPVWIADPRDAQYLNTTEDGLRKAAALLVEKGLLSFAKGPWPEGEFAAATPALMDEAEKYQKLRDEALALTRPVFNEEMRHGHTNM